MSIHVCKCMHRGREEWHLRYPGMTQEEAQWLADRINAEALRSNEKEIAVIDAPQDAAAQFCWLVELFEPTGNSMGDYHTGFSDTSWQSRSTKDPHQARRYNSKEEAERAASGLFSKAGVWRAIEHGFHAPESAQPPPGYAALAWIDQATFEELRTNPHGATAYHRWLAVGAPDNFSGRTIALYAGGSVPPAPADLLQALADLSFECDGVTCTLPPSRETYNRTFEVLQKYRALCAHQLEAPADSNCICSPTSVPPHPNCPVHSTARDGKGMPPPLQGTEL